MVTAMDTMNSIVTFYQGCPNVVAVARTIAGDDLLRRQQLIEDTCAKGLEAKNKLRSTFFDPQGSCHTIMKIYKSFALLQPAIILNLNAEEVERRITFMCGNIKYLVGIPNIGNRLRNELPRYIELAAQHQGYAGNEPDQLSNWWALVRADLPDWSIVVTCAVLFVPSSAGVERVFSMMTNMFNDNQDGALEDYKEASLMLRYNTIWRNKYI
jgi:hypothetical protein